MKRKYLSIVVVLVLLLAGAATASEEAKARPVFPDSVTFTKLDSSSTMKVSSFRGRPVLLTFWASWCGPCRVELPELSKLYGELAGTGFVLITVNVDYTPAAGRAFLQKLGIILPVYRMNLQDTRLLGIDALPTNILLDTEGRLVQAYKGYTPTVVEEVRRQVLEMTTPKEP